MRTEAFGDWLKQKGIRTVSFRCSLAKKVERALTTLGYTSNDLDEAFAVDHLASALRQLAVLGRTLPGGQALPILLPNGSKNPGSRLAGLAAVTRNYRDFANGRPAVREPEDADGDAVWFVTARSGETDGLPGFVDRGEWRLLRVGEPLSSRVREMRPGDRIVMRDYFHQTRDLPFPTNGGRVSAMRIRATGTVTEQRGDGLSVGVDWVVLSEPRVWYFYTNNETIWRLPADNEAADRLAAFALDGEEQDHAWFLGRPYWRDRLTGTSTLEMHSTMPINLILYGPPGTGKTYATAAEAVRLCGEEVAGDRAALMERYRDLVEAGRIGFVTFHQSYSYEDFVEGLRPEASGGGSGFSLVPRDGIFKQMATAALARPEQRSQEPFDPANRAVWKLSLGDVTKPDEAHIFDDCVAAAEAAIGFGTELDLTPGRFVDKVAIARELTALGVANPAYEASQLHMFRNKLQVGDMLVVASGLAKYRAIGVVEGGYEYDEDRDTEYRHRRAVKWLLVAPQGRPVSELLANKFQMQTLYRVPDKALSEGGLRSALAPAEAPAPAAPLDVVLVIDEINRANISKVFGELITLIEPDKRIGSMNEIRVRLPYSGDLFGVPANLHIVGTMNTADRSIALLDTALRRRFEFRELMPDADALGEASKATDIDLVTFLRTVNDRIEYLFDREHGIGHAFFIGCASREDVDRAMRARVIPLLAEYFFEDWGRIADVLGGREGNPFLQKEAIKPPPGLSADEASPRFRWRVRDSFADDAYAKAIAGIA